VGVLSPEQIEKIRSKGAKPATEAPTFERHQPSPSMSAMNIRRRLATWAVMAFLAAVLYVFITPWYRQGEPSIAGEKAEDFPVTVAGKQTRLSEF